MLLTLKFPCILLIQSVQVKDYGVVETVCIVIIFLISGLALKTEEILFAIKHPGPLIYGLVAILGVTPCLAFVTIRLPLQPAEFVIGTLSSSPSSMPCSDISPRPFSEAASMHQLNGAM